MTILSGSNIVSLLKNCTLIALLELRRVFVTRRGLMMLLAFALVWALLFRYVVFSAADWLGENGGGKLLGAMFNSRLIDALLSWKIAEFPVYWVLALYLFPLATITLAADQTASDRARGTLRLLSLHASRDSIYFGRFAGQLIIQLVLIAATVACTIGLALWRDPAQLAMALQIAGTVLVNLLVVVAPYIAAMAVVSICAGSARQATIWAVILWIVLSLLITWVTHRFPDFVGLRWILPGAQIPSMLGTTSADALGLAPVALLQTAALLLVGRTIMSRIDL